MMLRVICRYVGVVWDLSVITQGLGSNLHLMGMNRKEIQFCFMGPSKLEKRKLSMLFN